MDLETFIAETLRQIINGVKMAQEHEDCEGAEGAAINPTRPSYGPGAVEVKQIGFDVAVTVTEGTEKQGKGHISVSTVFGVGGQVSSTATSSSISRIKFNVPMILPHKK